MLKIKQIQKQKRRVLIANHANWEGISRLPYLLSSADFSVDVISPKENFIAQSSFLENHYPVPDHVESVVDFLRNHLSLNKNTYDQVIIGDDPLLYALCRISHETWVKEILPCNPDADSVEFISSKIEFITKAHQHGICVPDFEICANKYQLDLATARLGFPVVLKKSEGFGGGSIFFIKNQEELDNFRVAEPVVAQKFIEGRTVSVAALYDHGTLCAYYSYYRHRTSGLFGVSTAIKFKIFHDLEIILKGLGQISGFNGISGIDLIEDDKSGKLYLLEKNFRPTLTILIGKYVGVDLINMIKKISANFIFNTPIRQIDKSGKIVPIFPGDVLRAIDKLDLIGLIRWLFFPNYWREICWYDLKLLIFNFKYIMNFAFRSFAHACKGIFLNVIAWIKNWMTLAGS